MVVLRLGLPGCEGRRRTAVRAAPRRATVALRRAPGRREAAPSQPIDNALEMLRETLAAALEALRKPPMSWPPI